ncbi:ZYRO0E02442p [Zygosaccharomyces rouxii]|uniref:ZYRO0E02442p n=1 Tax=Zygosaccharomyces rouxii (strain ATCC 2623 / CBS 732 / NBRC 1130 / NCYC 568 / NRRL Y-229) TaxID=559307 RepID=C5E435_ZYGRC|nr:uncharacterized protein ZYRO0E02442g [Zygosaccharomyces rouxii]KAH9198344.1 hypothetical protein LQ764DRAFT_157727 [Zygosaccharomyces rouxii]CAR30796.1 ZYRO0E02442p [Zygosaccharomyces rouxii]
MQLQSNLAVLLEFDLNRLLAVQSDVTLLISRRVRELLDRSKELVDEHSTINDKDEDKGDTSIGIVGGDRSNHQVDDGDDSDDFILTQLGEHTGEKIWTHENEDLVTLRAELPKADISSPLKESQSLPDSYNHMKNDSRELDVQVEEDELPSANNNSRKELSQVTKKLCVRFPDNKPVVPRTNFNINPYTGKPWILEDFKRNEDINSVKKRQQNMKAQKIYAEGFPPPEAGRQSLIDKEISKGVENNFYEFENLRDRSHSPPGFGRLDFPNTQERFDDKQKSQNIIFHKTKWRFRKATCNAVPPYEREFLFKNDKLNEIVDDGTFEWNDAELQIYTRK